MPGRPRVYPLGSHSGPMTPLAKTFVALMGSQVLGKIIRFCYILIIARFLGPSDTAIYLYGLAVYLALGVVASFGQGVFLSTRMGRGSSTRSGLVHHSLTLRVLSTGLALGIGVIFIVMDGEDARIQWVLVIFLCTLVARSLADWLRELSTALEDAGWIARYEFVFRGLETLTGSFLLVLGGGVLELCVVHFAWRTLEAVTAMRLIRSRRGPLIRFGTRQQLLYRIATVSLVLAAGAGSLALFPQVSMIALKQLAPELAELAYFGIGLQVVMALMIFPNVLGLALLPAIGRMRRAGHVAERASLPLLIRFALLSGAVLALLGDAYAALLIDLALGNEFSAVRQVLADLLWVLGPYAATVLACQWLNAIGDRQPAVIAGLAMVSVGLVAMALAVPSFNLFGASLSFRLAIIVGCGLALWALWPYVGHREFRSWLQVLALSACLWAFMQLDLAPRSLLAPLLLFGAVVLSWRLKLLCVSEILFVLKRFGLQLS